MRRGAASGDYNLRSMPAVSTSARRPSAASVPPPAVRARGPRFAPRAALALAVLAAPAAAQSERDAARPTLTATRVMTAPAIDGEVLGDAAWSTAAAATGFHQTTPDEGEPATERTEVFVVYDDEALYVGVVCHDREPGRIIVADSRRDSSLNETDSFQLIFDTHADRQGGFVFGTNPAGIEFDGQVVANPSDGPGAGGNSLNRNWDAAWEVRAITGDFGWSAEFAIPWRSLRFSRDNGLWGVNFQRNIRRRNETAFWAPLPRQFDLYWVSLAGRLEGVEPPRQRTIQLTPYALGRSSRDRVAGPAGETETDEDFGIDFKLGLTPSLTLDATVNTDFAQVEADEQQINLDRFNLFFPEKRPFFLENAGLFSVGVPQEVELFFSRRIGLGPDGEEIPIDAGLRLSGKAGSNNLGILYMRADELPGVAPENDFVVARYSRDLPNRSNLGAIVVDRRGSGAFSLAGDENRTYGVDGRWGIGRYGTVQGFYASSDTPGLDGDDYALGIGGSYNSEDWSTSVYYSEVGEDFNPEVGFLRRSGYRKPEFRVLYRYRPDDWWGLQELRPHISYSGFWDFDDFQETGFLHVDNHWEFKRGHEVHTGINFRHEGVTEAFEIADGVVVPEGEYDDEEVQLVFFTNRGAPIGFESRLVIGGFFGGDRVAFTPELRFRVGETFNAEIEWAHNDIDLPGGSFKTNLGRMRLNYSFNPRMFLQGLVQYNDRADEWAANLRFAWLQDANTGFFVVYNEVNDIGSAGTGVAGRNLIVKYSRLIDLSR